MAAKIFLTGASGYIGGEVLYQLSNLPTKHSIRCLARNADKAQLIKNAFPAVEITQGDLDDSSLIESEAKAADVVFHLASTRHESSTRSIIKGLSDAGRSKPGYWLQIGGASMFSGAQIKAKGFGQGYNKTYDDVADIEEIRKVIRGSPARVIDNLILDQQKSSVKAALVVGPIIYGSGRGPANTLTVQGPAIAKYTIQSGSSFQIGKGENVWSTIHVTDIGKVFIGLLDAALKGKEGFWNENGIFLPENGQISFSRFGGLIAEAAKEQGLVQTEDVKSLTAEEVDAIVAHGSIVLGTTAQTKSSRANINLGWQPAERSLQDDIPDMVKAVAATL